jgi:uncharacterized membrane protein
MTGRIRLQVWIPIAGFAFILMLAGVCADAKPEFLDQFKHAYTVKSGGTIEGASCNLCHLDAPPKLNPYGTSVRSALDKAGARAVSAEILHSIDALDSDGDGFSNIEEIEADTLPGDPKSHPAGKPKAAAASASSSEQSPFDLHAIVFASHAQHPVLVHLPIGLFIASLLFDLIARGKKSPLNIAAYYNLALGAITAVFAVVTGIIAWQWKFDGAALVGNLRLHLILGIVTTVLMFALWAVRKKQAPDHPVSSGYLALAVITAAILALTGHIGGILSGVA